MTTAAELLAACASGGVTVATAESLTGGLAAELLTAVSGASSVFRGGVVAYATDLKHSVLGVDAQLLDLVGPIDPQVACQMARGVTRLCGSDLGLATTGVAGPDRQAGKAVGTAYIAIHDRRNGSQEVHALHLGGDRAEIRRECVAALFDHAFRVVAF
jgi:nicotinamide-nucleotide amidase